MMPKIDFSLMTFKEIPEVAKLEEKCFSSPWSGKALAESLKNEFSYFVCAKSGEKVAGYAGMYYICGEGYVFNIAVDENFRKMKIGTNLLKHLIDFSKSKNLKFLSLEVRQSNIAAINLYEKLGFKNLGIRKNFYEFPKENAVIMTLYFDLN